MNTSFLSLTQHALETTKHYKTEWPNDQLLHCVEKIIIEGHICCSESKRPYPMLSNCGHKELKTLNCLLRFTNLNLIKLKYPLLCHKK